MWNLQWNGNNIIKEKKMINKVNKLFRKLKISAMPLLDCEIAGNADSRKLSGSDAPCVVITPFVLY
jgi:hypothetical protein